MTRQQVLDLYFMDARSKLLDLAAFIDRVERAQGKEDFRMTAFRKALAHRLRMLPNVRRGPEIGGCRAPSQVMAKRRQADRPRTEHRIVERLDLESRAEAIRGLGPETENLELSDLDSINYQPSTIN